MSIDAPGDESRREWIVRLYEAHYAALCTFAYGYVASYDIAEDIVQDVMVSVWADPERWPEGRESTPILLYTATRNRALNYLKGRRVRERYAERTHALEPSITRATAAEEVVQKEIQQAIDDAIAALPPSARQIFRLSREDGLTYREIADHLQISIKTVETQMSRSLKRLRERLAPYLLLILLILRLL